MNENNHKPITIAHNGDHRSGRFWTYDEYTDTEGRPADSGTGFASFGFIREELRRSVRLWGVLALAGMLVGVGVAVKLHSVYQATTSLLMTPIAMGGENTGAPIGNEQAIAQSRSVAELAMDKVGSHESIASFRASYTATAVTDRVLVLTVSAPSGSAAVARANALATEFLRFRAELVQSQQKLLFNSLDQQVSAARENVKSINAQVSQVSAEPTSTAQQDKLRNLTKQLTQATTALSTLEQNNAGTKTSTELVNDAVVQNSGVLDAATLNPPHSHLKRLVLYAALGLFAGLVVGVGIVLLRALVSDRLRRRDDVAYALGAPVKLSVGPLRSGFRRRLKTAESKGARQIVAYLDSVVRAWHQTPVTLTVVPVDDVQVAAVCLVSLAISHAKQGSQVVVADLCDGAPAARLLGASSVGVQTVSTDGTQLVVVVPERDAVAPAGPFRPGSDPTPADESVTTVGGSADLMLTLATLDPSLGGDYLAGWTRHAVATVTAGQSSATRIRAVAEMIRLAGVSLVSGVLIGADKTDESLGLAPPPGTDGNGIADESLYPGAEGSSSWLQQSGW